MTSALDAAWPFQLRDKEVAVLALRPTRTLEEIGQEFGLTRERIRQIERDATKKLLKRSSNALADAMQQVKADLEQYLAIAESELAVDLPTCEDARRHILLRALGAAPVEVWGLRIPGWWTAKKPALERQFAELAQAAPFDDTELATRLATSLLPDALPAESVLSSGRSPVRRHSHGPWWVRRIATNRDAAFLWLSAAGEPRPISDIAAALGADEHPTREALRRDDRFVQLRPSKLWALTQWDLHAGKHRTALEAVLDILGSRGPLRYDELLSEMSLVYPVTEWRVAQCLTSDQIGRMPDGRVGLVSDGAVLIDEPEPSRPSNVELSSDGKLIGTRLPVDHDVLRGSGLSFPPFVAWHLGLLHAPSSRSFTIAGTDDYVTVARNLGMVQISSLRRFAQELELVDGCSLVVVLNLLEDAARVVHGCRGSECPKAQFQ